jgi:hypothetical protein
MKASVFIGFIFLIFFPFAIPLKPIVFMHGLMGSAWNFDNITQAILVQSPNTTVFALPVYEADNSIEKKKK